MANLDIVANIRLSWTPAEEVAKLIRREFRMKTKVRGIASIEIQVLETIFCVRDNKTGLSCRQVVNAVEQAIGRILDGHFERITLVHEQCLVVGGKGGIVRACRSWGAGGHSIHLDKSEVNRLRTVGVAEREIWVALQTINIHGRTPVRQITTHPADKWRETRRIELQFKESAAGSLRVVGKSS